MKLLRVVTKTLLSEAKKALELVFTGFFFGVGMVLALATMTLLP